MSTSTFQSKYCVYAGTATTGASGNLMLNVERTAQVISAYSADGTNAYMLLPFRDKYGNQYAKVMRWDTTEYTPVGNAEINYTVIYMT